MPDPNEDPRQPDAPPDQLLPSGPEGQPRRSKSWPVIAVLAVLAGAIVVVISWVLPRTVPSAAGSPSSMPSTSTLSTAPAPTQTGVVLTPTSLKATSDPRPLSDRRVGVGMTMLQVAGGPMKMCVGGVMMSLPPQCGVFVSVTGVDWAAITWKTVNGDTNWATVDVIGVLSGSGSSMSIAVEQIGPLGTFVVSSNRPTPGFSAPPMACLRSSDQGGTVNELAPGIEEVSGYQISWIDGQRFQVATVADPGEVEKQVRAKGYKGPLCVGTLDAPVHTELIAAMEAITRLDGIAGGGIGLQGTPAITINVAANTPELFDRITATAREKAPKAAVVLSPEFLALT